VEQAACPWEFGGEDGQARGDDHDRGAGEHDHGDADGDDEAAGDRDDDSTKLSQHRTSNSSAEKLQATKTVAASRKPGSKDDDRILLILMIVEVMYTVQVSFREHSLVPEPFLIVGLVAATRRILVLTAEFAELTDKGPEVFRNAMVELGLLTAMVLVLVTSILILKRRPVQADRA
jgi:hypothetical protein